MANKDTARGFWPIRHLSGGEIRAKEYTLTAGVTAYKGDVLEVDAAGTIGIAEANDGVLVIGVCAAYANDSASAGGIKVLVWDDPQIVFGVQCDSGSTPALTDVMSTANHVAGSANTTYKTSGQELDSSDIGTGSQCRIIALVDDPENAWGEHCNVEVLFVEHILRAETAVGTQAI